MTACCSSPRAVKHNIVRHIHTQMLTGAGGTDEGRDPAATQQKAAMAQIAQSKARITALESELANAKKSSEELQKQLTETARKLKVKSNTIHLPNPLVPSPWSIWVAEL